MEARLAPTLPSLALRALARYPDRVAFCSAGTRLTYEGAASLVGRMQNVMVARGVGRGQRVALLSSNRAEIWCASVAAQALGAATTPLHPMGSLETHMLQLEDADPRILVVDARAFRDRGGELAARCSGLEVLTIGPAEHGADLPRVWPSRAQRTA